MRKSLVFEVETIFEGNDLVQLGLRFVWFYVGADVVVMDFLCVI